MIMLAFARVLLIAVGARFAVVVLVFLFGSMGGGMSIFVCYFFLSISVAVSSAEKAAGFPA